MINIFKFLNESEFFKDFIKNSNQLNVKSHYDEVIYTRAHADDPKLKIAVTSHPALATPAHLQ